MMQKTSRMTETLEHEYSYENIQRELSNEYQHDRVKTVFNNLCILVLWMKVDLAVEGLSMNVYAIVYRAVVYLHVPVTCLWGWWWLYVEEQPLWWRRPQGCDLPRGTLCSNWYLHLESCSSWRDLNITARQKSIIHAAVNNVSKIKKE